MSFESKKPSPVPSLASGAPLEWSRRGFLGASAAAGAFLTSPSLRAARALAASGGQDRILVVLQLSGGNDGLNTVVPHGDPEYCRARGRLALPRQGLHELRAGLGLHPALRGLSQLHDAGKLAVMQGCGYPEPNRSHFKSMDIWHSADPSGQDLSNGWLGRAIDEGKTELAESAINVSTKSPLALTGVRYRPISFRDPAAYRYSATQPVTNAFEKLAKEHEQNSRNPVLAAVRRTAEEALETSRKIRAMAMAYKTPQPYTRQAIGRSLRSVAGLIAGGLDARVYYAYHGSFDTHASQLTRHGNLLAQLDAALTSFQKDLERLGVADRVCTVLFSEFGRRVRPNASGGTDHGVAGPMFVLGSRVRGGVHGEHPSLTELNKGDLVHTTDFRSVYASLLDDWLEVSSAKVLRGEHEKVELFRA